MVSFFSNKYVSLAVDNTGKNRADQSALEDWVPVFVSVLRYMGSK